MRGHEAGVTEIIPLPLGKEDGNKVLLAESYEDYIRMLSVNDYCNNQDVKHKVLQEESKRRSLKTEIHGQMVRKSGIGRAILQSSSIMHAYRIKSSQNSKLKIRRMNDRHPGRT